MWVVAGILLGAVVLGTAAGFHVGPHAHFAASALGVVAAVWLVIMAALGYSAPLLYVLLAADVTVSSVMGLYGWRALRTPGAMASLNEPPPSVSGKMGQAIGRLDPEGVVRVAGEDWSAISLNGPIAAGDEVQVINVKGVRLEVWGEEKTMLGESEPKGEGARP
jgi:membrane-bound ClpP family serine protease